MPRTPRYIDAILVDAAGPAPIHLGHWEGTVGAPEALRAAQDRLETILLELAEIEAGQRILDVGCGLGATLARIDREHEGVELVGVNHDARQLAIARTVQARNPLEWVEADACALPFEDASFDRALAIECIFHFASRRAFLAEAARVLRPGARLVFSDYVLSSERLDARLSREEIGARIDHDFGPWPELFSLDVDHAAMGATLGLTLMASIDATEATAPSYEAFGVPRDASEGGPALLAHLHRTGALRMYYVAMQK